VKVVLQQNFVNTDAGQQRFDGIFANASLFHVPKESLHIVLCQLHKALRDNGILFMSNPRGHSEQWLGARYGHYMELDTTTEFLNKAGFVVLNHYYRPAGLPLNEQRWLAVGSQKTRNSTIQRY
jgi:hypothetical protein